MPFAKLVSAAHHSQAISAHFPLPSVSSGFVLCPPSTISPPPSLCVFTLQEKGSASDYRMFLTCTEHLITILSDSQCKALHIIKRADCRHSGFCFQCKVVNMTTVATFEINNK